MTTTELQVYRGASRATCVAVLDGAKSGVSYVAFAASNAVLIHDLSPAFKHVQTLHRSSLVPGQSTHRDSAVVALAVQPRTGKIAAAYEDGGIAVFVLMDEFSPTWHVVHETSFHEPVTALEWINDLLLVAGTTLSAVQIGTWVVQWSLKSSSPIVAISASPCQSAFAIHAENDRFVKIWKLKGAQVPNNHSFLYLPHPRAVTSLIWQKSETELILLTNARDGVGRIWMWSTQLSLFQIVLSVDARAFHALQNNPDQHDFSYIWLNLSRIAPKPEVSVFLRNKVSVAKPARTDPELAVLVEPYDDLIMTLQPDGCALIWGVSHLLNKGRGRISLSLVKKIPFCVEPRDYLASFHMQVVHNTYFPSPEHILLLGCTRRGTISCFSTYTGNLLYRPNAKLALLHQWTGHMAKPPEPANVGVRRRQRLYVSAGHVVSQSGSEVLVWRACGIQRGRRHTNGLALVSRIGLVNEEQWHLPLPHSLPPIGLLGAHIKCGDAVVPWTDILDFNLVPLNLDPNAAPGAEPQEWQIVALGKKGIARYSLPTLTSDFATTISCDLGALFIGRNARYLAATYNVKTDQLTLYFPSGEVAAVHSLNVLAKEGDEVLSILAAEHKLIVRTRKAVRIFHIRAITHSLLPEDMLSLQPDAMEVFSLDNGSAILALACKNVLSVFMGRTDPSNMEHRPWNEMYRLEIDSPVSSLTWTPNGDVVIFAGEDVALLSPSPGFPQRALQAQSPGFACPSALCEWLMWDRPEQVRTIFDHLYYVRASLHRDAAELHQNKERQHHQTSKGDHPPMIPWERLCSATQVEDGAEKSLGAELDALFASDEAPETIDLNVADSKGLTPDKIKVLSDVFRASSAERDKELLAILNALSDPPSEAMDSNGRSAWWQMVLFVKRQELGLPVKPFSPEIMAFALVSDDQATLVEYLGKSCTLTWDLAKSLGLGWWITHPEAMRSAVEIIARNQWRLTQDPHKCFFFYLILGKKKLAQTLWKQASGHSEQTVMQNFLSQDYSDKWVKSALKNAFVLLGKQRFEVAASFFLLAESSTDAVTVCLRNQRDPQLACLACKLLGVSLDTVVKYAQEGGDEFANPCYMFMCDWMRNKRQVDPSVVTTPALYLLVDRAYAKMASQMQAKAVGSWNAEDRRRAGACVVAWYHSRHLYYFARHFMETLPKPEQPDAFDALFGDSVGGGGRLITGGGDGVADATAAFDNIFGEKNVKHRDTFDDIFGDSSATRPRDAFEDMFGDGNSTTKQADDIFGEAGPSTEVPAVPNGTHNGSVGDKPAQIILTEEIFSETQKQDIAREGACLALWDMIHSVFQVMTTELQDEPYFACYPEKLVRPGDWAAVSRLCWLTLSPSHYFHLTDQVDNDLMLTLVFRLLEDSQNKKFEEMATVVMDLIYTLAQYEDPRPFDFERLFLPVGAACILLLLKHYSSKSNYYAMASVVRNISPCLSREAQTAIRKLYLELQACGNESSSKHLILEYFSFRMLEEQLRQFLAENMGAFTDDVIYFIQETLLPMTSDVMRRVRNDIIVMETLIQSPEDDWLASAQQELFSAMHWSSTWLKDLENLPQPSRILPADLLATERPQSPSSDPKSPEKSSSVQSLSYTIDTLHSQDHSILSMCLGPHEASVVLAASKMVLVIDAERSYATAKKPESSSNSANSATPSADGSLIHEAIQKPSETTSFLKRVNMPRSQSDHSLSSQLSPEAGILSVRAAHPTAVASNGFLPFYALSDHADSNTVVALYPYNGKEERARLVHGSAKIAKMRFDAMGSRLAVGDSIGELTVYNIPAMKPSVVFPAHSRYTSDLMHHGASSVLVSAGSSPNHLNNVSLWDTLMPIHSARVRGYHIHESGASAIYSNGNYVVSGGKKGDICLLDMRQSKPLFAIQAHHSTISCLAMSSSSLIYSGSTDGNLKVWDLSSAGITEVTQFKNLHQSKKFLSASLDKLPVSSLGITEIIAGEGYVLTCGADGVVKWLH